MTNKKKILFSSIMTIAICFCLITGSTFALFTSESDLNIAITSGNVKLTASISAYDLWSIRALNNGETADTYDENNHGYKFQEQQNGTFANGGTAALDGNKLTLSRVTPGDKVRLTISGDNESDVITKVRYTVSCKAGDVLLDALVIRLVHVDGTIIEELTLDDGNKYVSQWQTLNIDANNVGEDMTDAYLEIELPASTGNDYQHDKLVEASMLADPNNPYTGVELLIHVEAVQGNGIID